MDLIIIFNIEQNTKKLFKAIVAMEDKKFTEDRDL